MSKRRVLTAGLGVGLLVAIGIVSAVVFSDRVRERLYTEIGYERVLDQALSDPETAEQTLLQLMAFVHSELLAEGGPIVDTYAWNDLVRGIGWCDQQATAVAVLAA